MNVVIMQYILLTFLGVTLFYGILGFAYFFVWRKKRLSNPIDVVIVELTQNGIRGRIELGRKEEFKGLTRVVTAGAGLGRRVKDNLGYSITDDDFTLSTRGRNRSFLMVAMKDGLTAPLRTALDVANKEDDKTYTEDEKAVLNKLYSDYSKPVSLRLDSIPRQLSLRPIIGDQFRFMSDYKEEKSLYTGIDPNKLRNRIIMASIGIFVISMIISFVIVIVAMTQAPTIGASIAPKTMAVASNATSMLNPFG